jgi:hypothetical protein
MIRPCGDRVRVGFRSWASFPPSSACAAHVIALVRSVRRRGHLSPKNDHNHTASTKRRRFRPIVGLLYRV